MCDSDDRSRQDEIIIKTDEIILLVLFLSPIRTINEDRANITDITKNEFSLNLINFIVYIILSEISVKSGNLFFELTIEVISANIRIKKYVKGDLIL